MTSETKKNSLKSITQKIVSLSSTSDRIADLAFTGEYPYTDAVESVHGSNGIEVQLAHTDLKSHVMARLSHVPVNPSNKETSKFIVDSYVQPKKKKGVKRSIPNTSNKAVSSFVDYLVGRSKIELSGYMASTQGSAGSSKQLPNMNQPIVVTGARGVGKSFFFSHVVSKFNDKLDAKKVIWVRINLVNDYGYDNNLIGWIHAQATKILLRYYSISSKFRTKDDDYCYDFESHMFDWIENEPSLRPSTRVSFDEKFVNLLKIFGDPAFDRDIKPVLCPDVLCAELLRYAREDLSLSFIVVLDGFDRLDSDKFHKERFDKLEAEVARYVNSRTAQGLQLVVASRNTTFEALVGHHPYRSVFTERFFIESPIFSDIFERRLETIGSWLSSGNLAGFSPEEVFDAIETVQKFEDYMKRDQVSDEVYNSILPLGNNNRAKCQVIQLLFQDFCQEKNLGGYKIIEHMVKANFTYPPLAYHHVVADNEIQPVPTGEYIYDSRFLPILTRPPISFVRTEEDPQNLELLDLKYILLETRVIQLVDLWKRRFHRDGLKEAITKKQLMDVLCGVFGYEERVVRAAIHDLECFEVLFVDRRGAFKTDSDDDRVRHSPKASYLLPNFLTDMAYLNFCGMRTLVAQGFLENHSFLKAASLKRPAQGQGSKKQVFKDWTSAKIANSLTMALLISAANQQQKAEIENIATEFTGRLAEAFGFGRMNSIFEDLDDVLVKIAREIFNATNSKNTDFSFDDLERILENYESLLA